jgi:hypothetical protein
MIHAGNWRKGLRFSTYATWWIRRAIVGSLTVAGARPAPDEDEAVEAAGPLGSQRISGSAMTKFGVEKLGVPRGSEKHQRFVVIAEARSRARPGRCRWFWHLVTSSPPPHRRPVSGRPRQRSAGRGRPG